MPKTEKQNEAIRLARKAAIFDSALHVFAEVGYHAASISQVSKQAKISKGLLYNYFDSKENLLKELLQKIMHDEVRILEFINSNPFNDDSVIDLINKTFELLANDPRHWKLYFMMSLQSDVLKMIMTEYAAIFKDFHLKFTAYFTQKYGNDCQQQIQYFNTIFSGMKLSFVMAPENYPIEDMKSKLIEQFVNYNL